MHRARRHSDNSSSRSIICYEPRPCGPDRRPSPMGDLSELIYWPMRFLSSVMPYYGWSSMLSPSRCGRCGQVDCRCRTMRCARCGEIDCRCRSYACPRCGERECCCGSIDACDIELVVTKHECKLDYLIDLDELDCDSSSLLKVGVLHSFGKEGEEHSIDAPEVEINRGCVKIIVRLDGRTAKGSYSAQVCDAKQPIPEILGHLKLVVY